MGLFGLFRREESFDEALLVGKWQCGTLYEKYSGDHTGSTWDIADDVSESEAQPLAWTLDKSTLTQVHRMGMGANVPKSYTILSLTSRELTYKDDYGNSKTFTKVG